MSSDPLPDPAISAALGQLPGWSRQGEALVITWRFPSFGAVIEFLADARPGIDQADHHPTWTNTYNRLAVRLSTHDAGDQITTKDVELAKTLSWLAGHHGAEPLNA